MALSDVFNICNFLAWYCFYIFLLHSSSQVCDGLTFKEIPHSNREFFSYFRDFNNGSVVHDLPVPVLQGVLTAPSTNPQPLPKSCTDAALVFSPVKSKNVLHAIPGNSTGDLNLFITPDIPGDYILRCGASGNLLRYVAVGFTLKPGTRVGYELVTDHSIGDTHSDTRYLFWEVVEQRVGAGDVGCCGTSYTPNPSARTGSFQKSRLRNQTITRLRSKLASDAPGSLRPRTSFFNEPLNYSLINIAFAPKSSSNVLYTEQVSLAVTSPNDSHNLTLRVIASTGFISPDSISEKLLDSGDDLINIYGNKTTNQPIDLRVTLTYDTHDLLFSHNISLPTMDTTYLNLSFTLDPKHFSIALSTSSSMQENAIQCGTGYINFTKSDINSNLDDSIVYQPCGTHGVNFRDWEGKTKLEIQSSSGINLTETIFVVQSELIHGKDPLRPGIDSVYDVLPAVIGADATVSENTGVTDEVGGFGDLDLPLGLLQPLSSIGFIDVTKQPFMADATGTRDATMALQHAVDFAKWHYLGVFIPTGNYTVTSTIQAIQTARYLTVGHIPGPLTTATTHDFILDGVSSRYAPIYIYAQPGATLVVPPKTEFFANASNPHAVVDVRMYNPMGSGEPNAMYNSNIVGLSVRIGTHNAGAIGVCLRGAQGSGLEDISVVFEGGSAPDAGIAGIVGGCGSGGAHHGVRVEGGRYGMDLRHSQPASTVSAATLIGQSCGAVRYRGFETLTCVGCVIDQFHGEVAVQAGWPLILNSDGDCGLPELADFHDQQSNDIIAGLMSWVDSSISFASLTKQYGQRAQDRVIFHTNRSLFLQNVFVKGAKNLLVAPHGKPPILTKNLTAWTHVIKLAHGERPGPYARHPEWQLDAPTFLNGERFEVAMTSATPDALANISSFLSTQPPSTLQSRHHWPWSGLHDTITSDVEYSGYHDKSEWQFPSFLSENALNVRNAPYNALGDARHDDSKAIQQALDDAGKIVATRERKYTTETRTKQVVVLLPRGVYAVSHTLTVPSGVALVGVAKHLSRLIPASLDGKTGLLPSRSFFTEQMGIWNANNETAAIHWYAKGHYSRQLHFNRGSRCGSNNGQDNDEQCPPAITINHPIMLVSGNIVVVMPHSHGADSGMAFWQDLKDQNGAGPVSFYHLNCEHGTGEAICELSRGAHDINVYGFKTEGNVVALKMLEVDTVSVFGTGGCGCVPNTTIYPPNYEQGWKPSSYLIANCTNILLANVMGQGSRHTPPNEFHEVGCDANAQNKILWSDGSKPKDAKQFLTPSLDRPVVFVLDNK